MALDASNGDKIPDSDIFDSAPDLTASFENRGGNKWYILSPEDFQVLTGHKFGNSTEKLNKSSATATASFAFNHSDKKAGSSTLETSGLLVKIDFARTPANTGVRIENLSARELKFGRLTLPCRLSISPATLRTISAAAAELRESAKTGKTPDPEVIDAVRMLIKATKAQNPSLLERVGALLKRNGSRKPAVS